MIHWLTVALITYATIAITLGGHFPDDRSHPLVMGWGDHNGTLDTSPVNNVIPGVT